MFPATIIASLVLSSHAPLQSTQPPDVAAENQSNDSTTIMTVLAGGWRELAQLKLDNLDPAAAEMAILRGVRPDGSENAAPFYNQLIRLLPPGEVELSDPQYEEIEVRLDWLRKQSDDLFADYDKAVPAFRQALAAGYCQWDESDKEDLQEAIEDSLPNLSTLRRLARWHRVRGDFHLAHDRPWDALRCYREMIALGRDVRNGDFLISLITGQSIEKFGYWILHHALPYLLDQGIAPRRLLHVASSRSRPMMDVTRTLNHELKLLRQSFTTEPVLTVTPIDNSLEFMVTANRFVTQVLQASRLEPPLRAAALNALMKKIENHPHPIIRSISNFTKVATTVVQLERTRRAINLLLAAVAHRDEQGNRPESIDQIRESFPELIPIDPVSGERFAIVTEGDRVRIAWPAQENEEKPYLEINLKTEATQSEPRP